MNFIEDVRNVHELPSIGAAVVIGGEVFSEVIGSGDLNDSIVYFMGNLSEVMVATTIAKLVSENRIGLDDPVAKHLPYFRLGNEQHEEITIRHLLTQSSGIPKHNAVWDIVIEFRTRIQSHFKTCVSDEDRRWVYPRKRELIFN